MHDRTWQLHDAVWQLAREWQLQQFRVECKVGPEGETIISLVLESSGPNPRAHAMRRAKPLR